MIQNIVLDMGNVLREFNPQKLLRNLQVDERDIPLILDTMFRSGEWNEYDRGMVTRKQVVEAVSARIPQHRQVVEQCALQCNAVLVPIEGMYELVEELKCSGYGIYLLSNASYDMLQYLDQLPVMRFFDGIMISAEVQCNKPEAQIYHAFFDKFNLSPQSCFFVDDRADNIVGANAVGMPGHVFTTTLDLRKRLAQEGILQ